MTSSDVKEKTGDTHVAGTMRSRRSMTEQDMILRKHAWLQVQGKTQTALRTAVRRDKDETALIAAWSQHSAWRFQSDDSLKTNILIT